MKAVIILGLGSEYSSNSALLSVDSVVTVEEEEYTISNTCESIKPDQTLPIVRKELRNQSSRF